jgi:hypothetical protein
MEFKSSTSRVTGAMRNERVENLEERQNIMH